MMRQVLFAWRFFLASFVVLAFFQPNVVSLEKRFCVSNPRLDFSLPHLIKFSPNGRFQTEREGNDRAFSCLFNPRLDFLLWRFECVTLGWKKPGGKI